VKRTVIICSSVNEPFKLWGNSHAIREQNIKVYDATKNSLIQVTQLWGSVSQGIITPQWFVSGRYTYPRDRVPLNKSGGRSHTLPGYVTPGTNRWGMFILYDTGPELRHLYQAVLSYVTFFRDHRYAQSFAFYCDRWQLIFLKKGQFYQIHRIPT